MKKGLILVATAFMASLLGSCSSSFYASAGMYDDLYATHNTTAIAARQQAEAEARKAEAQARRAEAEAAQAQWEAEVARLQAEVQSGTSATNYTVDADGLIIAESAPVVRSYQSVVADDYQSAYARRLLGFQSASYRMPSSYFNLRYGGSYNYVTAYDPAFYNIMVSGDQVWVEPKYITSMFGTWGATNATTVIYSPWYYGWSSYDPWYNSWWGFPHYSWYDWNWSICYGSYGVNLWWGWGGHYRPWNHYYAHYYNSLYNPYWGHHHHHYWPHHHHPDYSSHRDSRYYGSRGNGGNGDSRHIYQPSRSEGVRASGRSTAYRSPNNGNVYGNSDGGSRGSAATTLGGSTVNRTPGSVSRGSTQGTVNRGGAATSSSRSTATSGSSSSSRNRQGVQSTSSSSSRGTAYRGSQSNQKSQSTQQRNSSYNSSSRSSSSSSSSSRSSYNSGSSSRSSYSSGSSSRSSYGGGYSGGGSYGGGSRGGGSSSRGGGR